MASFMESMVEDAAFARLEPSRLRLSRRRFLGLGALAEQRGGVGYYPRAGFIHVDVGRVRAW